MTREQNQDIIKEACNKANPQLSTRNASYMIKDKIFNGLINCRNNEPQLSDVLLAIGEKYAMDGTGMLLERQFGDSAYDCAGMRKYDLTLPPLEQTDEVLEFISNLLG